MNESNLLALTAAGDCGVFQAIINQECPMYVKSYDTQSRTDLPLCDTSEEETEE